MCRVGGCFMPRELPPPGASRHPPHEDGGGMKTADAVALFAMTVCAPPNLLRHCERNFTLCFSLPFMGRGAKLVLSFPSHSCGAETSEARSGVARSAGWGQRISMREISRCGNKPHPSHPSLCSGCATLPTSGRDEDRRRGCTVATTARIFTHTHL